MFHSFAEGLNKALKKKLVDAAQVCGFIIAHYRKHEAKYAGVKDIIANNGATYGVSSALRDAGDGVAGLAAPVVALAERGVARDRAAWHRRAACAAHLHCL